MQEERDTMSPSISLFDNERIDIVNDGIKLIQKKDGLVFGTDALLLAGYIKKDKSATAVELGGGCGIISLLCAVREKAAHISVYEIQPEFANLCLRNADLNGLSDKITVINKDIRDACLDDTAEAAVDIVYTNPPYMRQDSGRGNENDGKNIARREVCGSIGDFCKAASKLLKFGGLFYAVYVPSRLPDLFTAMKDNLIEPKRLTLVCHEEGKAPCLILCEGKKNGKPGLLLTENLCIKKDNRESDDYSYIMNTGDFDERYRKAR